MARVGRLLSSPTPPSQDKATVTQGRSKPVSFHFIWGLKGKKILAHSSFSKQEKSRWDTGPVQNYFITRVITDVCSISEQNHRKPQMSLDRCVLSLWLMDVLPVGFFYLEPVPFDAWSGKISWRRKWQPTSVFLPGKSHGQRSLWLHWMIKWQASFRHSYEAKSQTTRIKFGEALRSYSCQTPHITDGKLKPREVNLFGRSFCLLIAKTGQEPRTAARYSGKNTGLWPSRSATH